MCREDRDVYFRDRSCATLASNERIRALAHILRHQQEHQVELVTLAIELEKIFDEEAWRQEVFEPLTAAFKRLWYWKPEPLLAHWPDATSILRAYHHLYELAVVDENCSFILVGQGSDGVVFRTDADICYKVFSDDIEGKEFVDLLSKCCVLQCRLDRPESSATNLWTGSSTVVGTAVSWLTYYAELISAV
jgi:hypothetical protein